MARRSAPALGMCASVIFIPTFSSVPSSSYWLVSPHGEAGHADVFCCAVLWLGVLLCAIAAVLSHGCAYAAAVLLLCVCYCRDS